MVTLVNIVNNKYSFKNMWVVWKGLRMTHISDLAIRQSHDIIQGEEKYWRRMGLGGRMVNSLLIKFKTYKQIIDL